MKKSIIDSFNYAVSGIMASIKSERNMRIHYTVAILVIIISLFFDFTRAEFLILLLSISLVLTLELINTAIESTIDMITKEYHPLAKVAKDIRSEEHTSELQSRFDLVCRLLLEKKKKTYFQ